ncbi:MAG: hypothetical protein U0984_04385 [Prosthecobacter sp.]|nr:hypothetical protein [Prosthecobacter sp.]
MNPPAYRFSSPRLTRLSAQLTAAVLLPWLLSGCGKKAEPPAPAPSPAPVVEQKPLPAPEVAKPAVAPSPPGMREPEESKKSVAAVPEPKAAVPEAKPAAPERAPADAAAWQLWDRTAERMRDIGVTVRNSTNPRRLEIVVNQMSDAEARTVVRNAYNTLGAGEASVALFDATGAQIAQATSAGVKGR